MSKIAMLSLVCALFVGEATQIVCAEEKVEVKSKKDGSWKMKVKRKDDKWVGVYGDKTYYLRGDATTFKDEGDYTVYGEIAPDDTYITTTRYERIDAPATRDTVVTERARDDGEWRMRVARRGDAWVGVHDGKTYELRGDAARSFKDEGEYTVHGKIATDGGYITTTHASRIEK